MGVHQFLHEECILCYSSKYHIVSIRYTMHAELLLSHLVWTREESFIARLPTNRHLNLGRCNRINILTLDHNNQ